MPDSQVENSTDHWISGDGHPNATRSCVFPTPVLCRPAMNSASDSGSPSAHHSHRFGTRRFGASRTGQVRHRITLGGRFGLLAGSFRAPARATRWLTRPLPGQHQGLEAVAGIRIFTERLYRTADKSHLINSKAAISKRAHSHLLAAVH